MATIDRAGTISLSKQSVWCDVGGEIAILHLTSGTYFGLEGAGCAIWQVLQEGPRTVTQIIDHLLASFEVGNEVCEQLTLAFLEELAANELIVVHANVAVA
jgi:hypothetical protein